MWEIINKERRQSTRYKVRIQCGISSSGGETGVVPGEQTELHGHARDISAGGLLLAVTADKSLIERVSAKLMTQLRVTLALPSGDVELRVAPVYYRPLASNEPEKGYLLGVRIMSMREQDWGRYTDYLSMLEAE